MPGMGNILCQREPAGISAASRYGYGFVEQFKIGDPNARVNIAQPDTIGVKVVDAVFSTKKQPVGIGAAAVQETIVLFAQQTLLLRVHLERFVGRIEFGNAIVTQEPQVAFFVGQQAENIVIQQAVCGGVVFKLSAPYI